MNACALARSVTFPSRRHHSFGLRCVCSCNEVVQLASLPLRLCILDASISLSSPLPLLSQGPWAGDYQKPALPSILEIRNERWLWLFSSKWFLHPGNKGWLFYTDFVLVVMEWCHWSCCRVKVPISLSGSFLCYSMADKTIKVNCGILFFFWVRLCYCVARSAHTYTCAQGIFPRLYSSSTPTFLKSFPLHCVKVWFFRCLKIKELRR